LKYAICCRAGLDSFAALNVMGYLQDLAASSRQTVIATIHQPRSAIWGTFDTVSSAEWRSGAATM
jgi:ABC-type multidrug transport system ATPase subunit